MPKTLILAAVLCLFPALAPAAEIEFAPPITEKFVTPFTWNTMEGVIAQRAEFEFADLQHIRISGPIEAGDAQRLTALIESEAYTGDRQHGWQSLIVSFDSPGGSYQEGLALSDIIRDQSAATYVGAGDSCLSACALAWLGGRRQTIRAVMWQPSRFLHIDAELGFHAPFNREYPEGAGNLGQAGIEMVADLFYALARESIRDIQARMADWQVRPEFLVELLGKGPDEFLMIDRAAPLFGNAFTLLAPQSRAVRQIGLLEGAAVCDYVLMVALAPADGYRMISRPQLTLDFTNPADLVLFARGAASWGRVSAAVDAQGIKIGWIVAGRGPFECHIRQAGAEWQVTMKGDFPRFGDQLEVNDDRQPFVVTEHNALGLQTPWTVLTSDDLYLGADPFAAVPAEFLREDGPSFDCNADLDKAARVICAFPVLARADAIMVAAYGARKDVEGVRDAQRQWVAERNRDCRVGQILPDEASSFRMSGYCLLAFTLARIQTLTES